MQLSYSSARNPLQKRRTAIYVTSMNKQLYGGTVGSSSHDVIRHAGLRDAAAGKFEEWPSYSAEQLLQMDPDHILTRRASGAGLCRHPGLDRLRVCKEPWRIITLEDTLLSHPGPRMLEAAEQVYDAVYGNDSP